MTDRRLLHAGLALAVASVLGLGASLVWLVSTLRERNVTTMRLVGEIGEPDVTIQGHRLTVERVPDFDEPPEDGQEPVLRLTWRGNTHDFPMGEPVSRYREGLERYREWFAVLILVDGAATRERFEELWTEGEAKPRLVAAARYRAPGYDPDSWGLVRRQEWVYALADLALDGADAGALTVVQKNYEQLDALYLPGKYTDEAYLPSAEERDRDLWQYYAMLQVTPDPQVRGRNKVIEPLMRDMGLAWPAAGLSALGVVVAVLMIAIALRSAPAEPAD